MKYRIVLEAESEGSLGTVALAVTSAIDLHANETLSGPCKITEVIDISPIDGRYKALAARK